MANVASVDFTNKRVHLHLDTVTNGFNIIDAHFEIKALYGANTFNEQNFKFFLWAEGKIPKGGGAFTPRYGYVDTGWRFVPYNGVTHQLKIYVEMVSKEEITDVDVFDFSGLTVNVHVIPVYTPTEIIEIATGGSGSVSEEDIHNALDSYLNKGDWKADVSNIPSEVWANAARTLTINTSNTEVEIHQWLNSYANKSDWKADVTAVPDATFNKFASTDLP